MSLDDYDYGLPPDLIAQAPREPRDAARLLVLSRRTGRPEHRVFHDLPALLAPYWRHFEDAFKYERWFDDDPACPEWVKKHDGPFFVQVAAVRAFEPR